MGIRIGGLTIRDEISTVCIAACSSGRGVRTSIASHSSSRLTSPPAWSVTSNSTDTARASFIEARASRGWARSVSLSLARSALPRSSVTISRSSSSNASSMALPCRYATVAATVAQRLAAGWRRSAVALAAIPARANSSSRRRGTPDLRTSVGSLLRVISPARLRAFSRFLPEGTDTPLRQRSSSDTRAPSPTTNRPVSRAQRAVRSSHRVRCSRSVASTRTLATSRAKVLTPGSSTRCARK